MPQAKQEIRDKEGNLIKAGDTVTTTARARKHRGVVEAVVITADDAAEYEVNNPPKIVFNDETGHRFVQNPKALLVEKKAE